MVAATLDRARTGGAGPSRRILYRRGKRMLLRLLAARWCGPRRTLEPAVRRYLRLLSRRDLWSLVVGDRRVAIAAVMALLASGSAVAAPPIELSDVAAGIGGFVINGIDANDLSGYSASGAGDVNGDGLADLIVGAQGADPGGNSNAGESYVVFGKTSTTAVDLAVVVAGGAGAGGFVIIGFDADDWSGFSVSGAGDVNGDGLADLVVGAMGADVYAGATYVVFGKADTAAVNLATVAAGAGGGFVINGIDNYDQSGRSISGAGDVNGDGFADLIVGAQYADAGFGNFAGESYVVFGKASTAAVDLAVVAGGGPGAGGFVINGIDATYGYSGGSVSGAGDVNGDGLADLIVGARGVEPGGDNAAGASYVVFGKAGTAAVDLADVTAGTGGFVINGIDPGDRSGTCVSGAGDVNGDNLADLIVGAPHADPGGDISAGESYVVFGKASTTAVDLAVVAAGAGGGFVINGIDPGDQGTQIVIASRVLSGAGDVNGDGLADLIVGARYADAGGDSNAGESYVVFGKVATAAVELADVAAGTGGFVINGIDVGDQSGSVSGAGDVNGDGSADLIVGAWGGDPGGDSNAGESYVIFLDPPPILFDPSVETLAAGAGDFVATDDLDSDGDDDAVIVIPGTNPLVNGHVQVFLNQGSDGNGGWLGFVANPAIEVGKQPSGVAVGLFDDDAHLDIAVTNAGDANVTILLNTGAGNGTFTFDQNITVGLAPQAIAAADFNGAGLDDLAVTNEGDDNVMIITNTTPPSPLGGKGAERREAGEAGEGEGEGEAGEGLPLVSLWMVTATIPVGDAPVSLEPEDVDNDKDLDLIVANRNAGSATFLFLNAGDPGTSQTVTVGGTPVDVASADLDANGFADAAIAIESDDVVSIIPNEGGGVLGAPETIAVGVGPESVELTDLDNDKDPDLAVVAQDANVGPAVQIRENLGPSGGATADFGPLAGFGVGANPNYVVSADIDGDSHIDLVTVNDDPHGPTGGSVSVLLNLTCPGDHDGSGNVGFGDVTLMLISWGPCPALPANCPWDFDHDGVVGFNDLTLLLLTWGPCE